MPTFVEVRFTHHGLERAREMGLELETVVEVVRDPEVDYSQSRLGEGRRLAQRGALAVAYVSEPGLAVIVTVLERKVEQWERPSSAK